MVWTYIVWEEPFVSHNCGISRQSAGRMTLETCGLKLSRVVYGYYQESVSQLCQLHGFLYEPTLSLLEADLKADYHGRMMTNKQANQRFLSNVLRNAQKEHKTYIFLSFVGNLFYFYFLAPHSSFFTYSFLIIVMSDI